MLIQAGEDITKIVTGVATDGIMNVFLTTGLTKTGRTGETTVTGKTKEPGTFRTISLVRRIRNRTSEDRGKTNMKKDLKSDNRSGNLI